MKEKKSAENVLQTAARLFLRGGLDGVSISQIARGSHCSSATIYDMFGSKESLFLEALAYGQGLKSSPDVALPDHDGVAIMAIVDYLYMRINHLTSPRTRELFLSSARMRERTGQTTKKFFKERDQFQPLKRNVEAAMTAQDIRPGESAAVTYCMISAVSFEPIVMNILDLGNVASLRLLNTAISPFVTDQGKAKFEQWLEHSAVLKALESDDLKYSARAPLCAGVAVGMHDLDEP